MTNLYELKLGSEVLEALKVLLERVDKFPDDMAKLDLSEFTSKAEHIETLVNNANTIKANIEQIQTSLNALKSNFERDYLTFGTNFNKSKEIHEQVTSMLENVRSLKESTERSKETVETLKQSMDGTKSDFDTKYAKFLNEFSQILTLQGELGEMETLFTQLREVLDSGIIDDSQAQTQKTYSSSKISELNSALEAKLNEKEQALQGSINQAKTELNDTINSTKTELNEALALKATKTELNDTINSTKTELNEALALKATKTELTQKTQQLTTYIESQFNEATNQVSQMPKNAKELTDENLNAVKDFGFYFCKDISKATSLNNYPTQECGSLMVLRSKDITQIYTPKGKKWYSRTFDETESTWSEWVAVGGDEVAGSVVLESLETQLNTVKLGTQFFCKANSNIYLLKANDSISEASTLQEAITANKLENITPLGVGQTWQDMKSQRQLNVTYTNNTGRAIMVAITFITSEKTNSINVDGLQIQTAYAPYSYSDGVCVVIPSGSTYKVNNTIYRWHELR